MFQNKIHDLQAYLLIKIQHPQQLNKYVGKHHCQNKNKINSRYLVFLQIQTILSLHLPHQPKSYQQPADSLEHPSSIFQYFILSLLINQLFQYLFKSVISTLSEIYQKYIRHIPQSKFIAIFTNYLQTSLSFINKQQSTFKLRYYFTNLITNFVYQIQTSVSRLQKQIQSSLQDTDQLFNPKNIQYNSSKPSSLSYKPSYILLFKLMNFNYSQTNLSTSSYSTQRLLQLVTEGNRDTLEKHLANTPIQDSDLNQALFCCINNCSTLSHHEECLLLLLRYRADPNCIINDKTPLMSACTSGHQIMVRRLLQNGAKVDIKDPQGNHPLFYAMNRNTQNFDVIELLIDRMNNLNLEIAKKTTPVAFSIRKEFDRTLKKLLQRNITPYINQDTGDTLLHTVCKQPFRGQTKQARIIKLLLNKISPNIKNKQGKTASQYLHNEEMKQIVMDFAKPKLKQNKIKLLKKQTQQEELDLSCDDLQQQSSPNNSKMLGHIIQESDEEKRTDQKKDKVSTKAKKLPFTTHTTKTKDLLKSITKSSSNQKFKEIKQVKQQKQKDRQKQKQKVKYQRKKSSKSALIKQLNYTPNKQSMRQSVKQSNKQCSIMSTKQALVPIKQVPSPNKQCIQDASYSNTSANLKEESRKQSNTKQVNLKQSEKQYKLRVQLQIEAKRKQKEQEIRHLKQEAQKLEKQIQDIEIKLNPDDQYIILISKQARLNKNHLAKILTKQIKQFVVEEEKACKPYYHMNQQIVQIISNLLAKHFIDQKIKVDMYGSQSSGLCLQTSDLDLVIQCWCAPFQFLQLIESKQLFNVCCSQAQTPQFKQVKYIRTASVPIIKLQMSSTFAYRRVDITFQTYFHNGVKCNTLLRQYISKMDQLKPLVLVIKKLLLSNEFHDTYTGGLGSYSVVLLVVAFLQSTSIDKKAENSLGLLLLQFLRYYGFQMDYVGKSIIVYSPQFQQIPFGNNIFQQFDYKDYSCKLILRDPLNPNNNVSRSTYKIKIIKQLFMLSYNKLFFNRRCGRQCKQKQNMTMLERKSQPCCILQRLFAPEKMIRIQ